jgi:hypothetical protein
MTASVDGSSWAAVAIGKANYTNGFLDIAGADSSNPIRTIGLALIVAGPGTFAMGTLPSAANAIFSVGFGQYGRRICLPAAARLLSRP